MSLTNSGRTRKIRKNKSANKYKNKDTALRFFQKCRVFSLLIFVFYHFVYKAFSKFYFSRIPRERSKLSRSHLSSASLPFPVTVHLRIKLIRGRLFLFFSSATSKLTLTYTARRVASLTVWAAICFFSEEIYSAESTE